MANIDKVKRRASEVNLPTPYRITLPTDDKTAWKATSERQRFPINRDEIAVDGATGTVTSRFDYSTTHWFNQLSTAGIAFHQAQLFGVGSQLFMTLLAIGVIALVVFGYRMWWQRRPKGGMGEPPPIRAWLRNAPLALLAIVLVLAWALPTLALSLARLARRRARNAVVADRARHTEGEERDRSDGQAGRAAEARLGGLQGRHRSPRSACSCSSLRASATPTRSGASTPR